MKTKHIMTSVILSFLMQCFALCAVEKPLMPGKPNVVIILADDLGYGDVQCYNPERGKIPTPNIDRLASQGMRFTDGHSSSGVCSPSRYALLTGRYHWRSRLQKGIVNMWEEPLIAADRLTIASLAKQNGYRTACVGKWHLGWDWPIEAEQRRFLQSVRKQGKDDEAPVASPEHLEAWGKIFSKPVAGGPITRGFDEYFGTDVPNWPPYCFIENDRTVGIPSELLPKQLLGGNPHLASQPGPALKDWKLEAILPALGDRVCASIGHFAEKKEPFLIYMPLTSPHEPIAVNDSWKGKSGLNAYADFVMETDAIVGRVLDSLDKSGMAENTLVIFTSDNGKAPYTGAADLESKGHYPNGPLRGYKTSVYEGGHRVPFIVSWPGVIKAGSTCGRLVHQADIMATLADIMATKLPDNAAEDSFSFLPLMKGDNKPVRQHAVSCAASGIPGLRSGPWKLVLVADPKAKTEVELYNLDNDVGEMKNLAAEQPERVAEMKILLEKLITDGRSTPGAVQKNDVEVRRFPRVDAPVKKARKAAK